MPPKRCVIGYEYADLSVLDMLAAAEIHPEPLDPDGIAGLVVTRVVDLIPALDCLRVSVGRDSRRENLSDSAGDLPAAVVTGRRRVVAVAVHRVTPETRAPGFRSGVTGCPGSSTRP